MLDRVICRRVNANTRRRTFHMDHLRTLLRQWVAQEYHTPTKGWPSIPSALFDEYLFW